MLSRFLARFWHWLTDSQPWNRHAPYPHGDPPSRKQEPSGMDWDDE